MMMLVLCCVGAFGQAATEWVDKLIRVGAAQDKMVPGQWYFLHNPRGGNLENGHSVPGEAIKSAGGLVTDNGVGENLTLTASGAIDMLTSEEGVSANDNMDKLVRFVAVEGVNGAYNIQFGTGNWLGHFPDGGSGTVLKTVNNNQYLSGQAGQYNFYLIKFNGEPNTAGRFGWNRYDMAQRVDNNGAGGTVVFWDSGESIADGNDLAAAESDGIKGNRVWQIFEVEDCGAEDPWDSALAALVNTMNSICERDDYAYVSNLRDGINVGNSYGNYRAEDVQAFLEYEDRVEEVIGETDQTGNNDPLIAAFETVDNMRAYHEAYKAADEKVRANKIPLAVSDIVPGYYTINNVLEWYEAKKDTVYYTQEECDKINVENNYNPGDEGYLTPDSTKEVQSSRVPAPIKSLCSRDDDSGQIFLAWGTQQPKSEYLWKIENVEGREAQYRLINMYRGHTFTGFSNEYAQMVEDDTVTVVFDYKDSVVAPVINEKVLTYGIRTAYNSGGEDGGGYVHCWNHASGAGTQYWATDWYCDGKASRWYLAPVDDETADLWINGDEAKLRKMFAVADEAIRTVPAEIEIAKDIVVTVFENDSVVTDASQFFANTLSGECDPDDPYAALLDGNTATFWHSAWEDGDVAQHVHYLQVEADEALEGTYVVKLGRRAAASNDHPVKLAVRGYDANDESLAFEDGEDLGVLDFPFDGAATWATAKDLFDAKGKSVIRFYWEDSNGEYDRGYWHCSGFNIFRATRRAAHEKTQYEVRSEIIGRLEAAIKAWNDAEYSAENTELLSDPAFNATYNELIEANAAWKAVYVNPAALRDAIKAAPAENLFVVGNNPGQWKEGAVTPAATVNEAEAYDASGAYTQAESERLIKAIADVTAEAFASANKVETGKWYRIKFPAEEMYETYEWSKTAAQAAESEFPGVQYYPALFGKTAAAGKSVIEYIPYVDDNEEEDTLATYQTAVSDELFNGHGIYFFDDEQMEEITNGEDLFRFIQAMDSSYIIQNKATGLFLSGGQPASLSDVPTYFYTKALGAGVSLITYTSVLGEKARHCNLHGQRSNNALVCWEANTLGSNSGLLIEEVEDVVDEPSTEYAVKLWPGSVYAYTTPVDVTLVGTEATAYGAQLVVGNEKGDTAVVLKKIEAETIKAGTPYILVAENSGEYISPADRLKEIAADITASTGSYGYNEKQMANDLLDEEYVPFTMNHGMTVDTIQKGNGDLVGTFRDVEVEAGKGLVTKTNGFAHTVVNTTVSAYGAYIKSDFDGESADVLGTIVVEYNGSITDGIDQVLDKVAKSGNIYTVDGKFVGKGNINTVNNLPAGIYVVNGVKVTKK